jgi:hypothetical protein
MVATAPIELLDQQDGRDIVATASKALLPFGRVRSTGSDVALRPTTKALLYLMLARTAVAGKSEDGTNDTIGGSATAFTSRQPSGGALGRQTCRHWLTSLGRLSLR